MADPAAATVLETAAATGGRMSLAVDEANRLLSAVLPGAITLANSRESTSLPVPSLNPLTGKFYLSGESLLEAQFPAVTIGGGVSFAPLSGQTMRRVPTLEVFLLMPKLEIGQQILTLWDLGELVTAIMFCEMQRHCLPDPDGRCVWKQMLPGTMDLFEGKSENREYSGVKVSFQFEQSGLVLWPQS